jgi:hypothetical protein
LIESNPGFGILFERDSPFSKELPSSSCCIHVGAVLWTAPSAALKIKPSMPKISAGCIAGGPHLFVDRRMGNCLAQNSARWSIVFPRDVHAYFTEGIIFHNEFVTTA